ncbi:hypothetical protein [Litorivivens sp.]|uniref:TA system antitoxin ParD family protein n=1 Tax=Litorivivens sp. TaxID=2020868 RepID=UPI00356A5385
MPKANSPVRIQRGLMADATAVGKAHHRSAAEQIEYWADIGRKVSKIIDPDALLRLTAGVVKIALEPAKPVTVDPDDVFAKLDRDRESGAIQAALPANSVRYQACRAHPGKLERISSDGSTQVGEFKGGQFIPDRS